MTGSFPILMRHFVDAALAPEVLTEAGADYLRRTLFGVVAVLLVVGMFVTRAFFDKYTQLGSRVGSEAYLNAVQADTLFMMALPMLLVGLAAVVAGPLLFPDETDYRVLTPLPISRAELFLAKLAAVAGIVAVAIVAVNIITTFWFPIAISGRKAQHPLFTRFVTHAIASLAGSTFMCLAVMAVQGAMIVAVPSAWQRRMSVVVQGAMCVGLLVCLPIVSRMPGMDVTSATVLQPPLSWLPPSWFLGVQRWLLDGGAAGGYTQAAARGGLAIAIALALVVTSYVALYRSAERLAGVAGANRRSRRASTMLARRLMRLAPQTLAIVDFIRAGIARSRLHQFVFTIGFGTGIAVLIGDIAAVIEGASPMASRPGAPVQAAISAPMLVALAMVLALRTAMKWPLERDAAWIFRITEDPRTRAAALGGASWTLAVSAWLAAVVTAAVLQPRVIGATWIVAAALTSVAVLALVEFVLIDWRRIPFACTYLPGKHVLAYHMGVLFAQYFIFVVIGGNVIRAAVLDPARSVALGGFLIAGWAALRRARMKTWGDAALEFEDDDPSEATLITGAREK
jgi:hypothetical protein